jgi:hypothetical protein
MLNKKNKDRVKSVGLINTKINFRNPYEVKNNFIEDEIEKNMMLLG